MTSTDIINIAELWHSDPRAALELADRFNASRETEASEEEVA